MVSGRAPAPVPGMLAAPSLHPQHIGVGFVPVGIFPPPSALAGAPAEQPARRPGAEALVVGVARVGIHPHSAAPAPASPAALELPFLVLFLVFLLGLVLTFGLGVSVRLRLVLRGHLSIGILLPVRPHLHLAPSRGERMGEGIADRPAEKCGGQRWRYPTRRPERRSGRHSGTAPCGFALRPSHHK